MSGGRKVVQLVGINERGVPFSTKIGKGRFAKTADEMEQILSDVNLFPIPITPIGTLDESKFISHESVVFVKTKKLIQAGFNGDDIRYMRNGLRNRSIPLEHRIYRLYVRLTDIVGYDLFWDNVREDLIGKWSQPVDPFIIEKAEVFYKKHGQKKYSADQIESLEDLRVEGSGSIQSEPKKREGWKLAEKFMDDVIESGSELTLEIICKINALILRDAEDVENRGELRKGQIKRTGYYGIAYVGFLDVESLTYELIAFINKGMKQGDNPIILAAIAYQRLVSIHPFEDGNGRVCRFVMNYILQRSGLPPAALVEDELNVAIYGGQENKQPEVQETPTTAVEKVLLGLQRSIEILS